MEDMNKNLEEKTRTLADKQKELIETMQPCSIENIRLSNTRKKLFPIVENLETTNIDKDDSKLLSILEWQMEIWKALVKIIKNPLQPDNTQYRDRSHRISWEIYLYFWACDIVANWLKERPFDEDMMECFSRINKYKPKLIETIKSLNDITISLKEATGIDKIISYIRTKLKTWWEVHTEDDAYILCSNRVFKAIIDEISENYRKYGTNGYISIVTKDNKLIITLTNKKKEKNPENFSSGTWTKIFKEYMK